MDTTTRAHREPSIAPSERATVHTDKFSVADHADLATSFTHTNSHSHKKGGAGHGDKDPGHDGAHSLKMTVHLDYFLDKKKTPASPSSRDRSGNKEEKKKRRKDLDGLNKYFMTYKIGSSVEGKSETLYNDDSQWSAAHDILINEELLTDLYENHLQFQLWQVVKNDAEIEPQRIEQSRPRALMKNWELKQLDKDALSKRQLHISPEKDDVVKAKRKAKITAALEDLQPKENDPPPKQRPLSSCVAEPRLTEVSAKERAGRRESVADRDDESNYPTEDHDFVKSRPDTERSKHSKATHDAVREESPEESAGRKSEKGEQQTQDAKPSEEKSSEEEANAKKKEAAAAAKAPPTTTNVFENVLRKVLKTQNASFDMQPHNFRRPDKIGLIVSDDTARSRASSATSTRGKVSHGTPAPGSKPGTAPAITIQAPENGQGIKVQEKLNDKSPNASTDMAPKDSNASQISNADGDAQRPEDTPLETLVKSSKTTGRRKAPPSPHHHDAPDKMLHINRPHSPIKFDEKHHLKYIRPKTPPSPHHYDSPEKMVKPMAVKYTSEKKVTFKYVLVGTIHVDPAELFFGNYSVTGKLNTLVDGITSAEVSVCVNNPLLSEEQELSLNPMSITVIGIDGLPNRPTPFAELEERCHPLYTKFCFYDDPHVREAHPKTKRAHKFPISTRHLLLAGLLDEDSLRENLLNKKFVVEVHDRDLKLPTDLSKVANSMSKSGAINSGSFDLPPPFGVAEFSLGEMVRGALDLTLHAPIIPARQSSKVSIPSALWLESNSNLRIRISLSYPILSHVARFEAQDDGIFGRMVLNIDGADEYLCEILDRFILLNNARLLLPAEKQEGLDELSSSDIRSLLARFRLTGEQRKDKTLDIITGYQIFDGQQYYFLLEGLPSGALALLEEELKPFQDKLRMVYYKEKKFRHRIWASLATTIERIQLLAPVTSIMNKASTYVRSKTSRNIFDSLLLFHQLTNLPSIPVDVFFKLLPDHNSVQQLADRFGKILNESDIFIPLTANKLFSPSGPTTATSLTMTSYMPSLAPTPFTKSILHTNAQSTPHGRSVTVSFKQTAGEQSFFDSETMYATDGAILDEDEDEQDYLRRLKEGTQPRIETWNPEFAAWVKYRHNRQPNMIALNKSMFHPAPRYPRERHLGDDKVHNYSTQTYNELEIQRESFRQKIEKDSTHFYTYETNMLARTFCPVSEKELKHEVKGVVDRLAVGLDEDGLMKNKPFYSGPFSEKFFVTAGGNKKVEDVSGLF